MDDLGKREGREDKGGTVKEEIREGREMKMGRRGKRE